MEDALDALPGEDPHGEAVAHQPHAPHGQQQRALQRELYPVLLHSRDGMTTDLEKDVHALTLCERLLSIME